MKLAKTYQMKSSEIKRSWRTLDANGAVLGRLASQITGILMGKDKATYTPHMDMGDFVVVINAEKVKVTGAKEDQKKYYRHSGYPGGFKEVSYSKMKKEHPARVIELAVKRMLPKNRLQDDRMNRLKVVVGENNPYGKN